MKIPKIVTKHKIRDAKICALWAKDLWTMEAIGQHFNISATRVSQILYKNQAFIDFHKDWEKKKRIIWLKKQIKNAKDSKKDPADLQLQLKLELEGAKPLIQVNHNNFFNNIIKKPKLAKSNRIGELIEPSKN